MEQSCFNYIGLSIILYMYAFTHTFFRPHEYESISSEEIEISEQEVFNLLMIHMGTKAISSKFT